MQSGHGTVTTQVFPATSAAYDKSLDSHYSYDPKKAKELLAEAGYPNGLTIRMPTASVLGATTYTLIAPTAVFNPFRYSDPKVNDYLKQIQYGDRATQDSVVKELNKYIVEQAWFAPFSRVQGSFATNPNTSVTMMPTNAYPAIYDFTPKSSQLFGTPSHRAGRSGTRLTPASCLEEPATPNIVDARQVHLTVVLDSLGHAGP